MSLSRRKQVAIASATLLALLAIIITRAVWQGRNALARGDAAMSEGRVDDAIMSYRRAARWYVPLAPHVERAYDRLEQTARAAADAGDKRVALSAWRGIRSSIFATRSFYTPFSERLSDANSRIATLMAELEGPDADPGKDEAARVTWHRELLERPVGPSVLFSMLAIVGFLAWIGGSFWFALAGLTGEERLDKRTALRSGSLFLGGLILWLVSLYLA